MKFTTLACLLLLHPVARADVKVVAEHIEPSKATAAFKFPTIASPRGKDAGAKATFTIVDGEADRGSADLKVLHDGALPADTDAPRANFFFATGTEGGRLLVDLGSAIDLGQINTYSWHPQERGPQVYRLYASDGKAEGFSAQLKRPADPEKAGWKLLASVDTRPKEGPPGGQYGVNIADSSGSLGQFRYLLFDIQRTTDQGASSNTFFSEIDIVDKNAPSAPEAAPEVTQILKSFDIEGGYRFTIETTDAPDLNDWAYTRLAPVVQKWYPLIVKMLPSEGFNAPRTFSINFTNSYKGGVAATAGNRVMCSPAWYRGQLNREAIGATVHELVHVVQQYWGRRRRDAAPNPGWLVEGLCDYIRWYLYEPESHGADIRPGSAARARYDGSYRPTGNFLNFVVSKYDKDLIKELNTAMREGHYSPEIWKARTKLSVEELAEDWKKYLANPTEKIVPVEPAKTPAEPAKTPAEPAKADPAAPKPAAPAETKPTGATPPNSSTPPPAPSKEPGK